MRRAIAAASAAVAWKGDDLLLDAVEASVHPSDALATLPDEPLEMSECDNYEPIDGTIADLAIGVDRFLFSTAARYVWL